MKPTLTDIARQTRLSVATVSRALHRSDSPNVSRETRRRVCEVARELGYRPNLAGRSLVTGRSHTVSYWTYDAATSYYAMVGGYICREASRRGYNVVLNTTPDPGFTLQPEQHTIQSSPALHAGFDGIIACDVAYQDNDYAAELRSLGVPFVGIGINYPRQGDFVGLDLYAGAVMAVRHLLDEGCRRVAMLGLAAEGWNLDDPRSIAYATTLKEAGLPVRWINTGSSRRSVARQAVVDALSGCKDDSLPDAIFCINDDSAIGCYHGLRDLGLRVPEDVLLIGCDGIEDVEYVSCPLTSLVSPVKRMCELAWDLLEERIKNPSAPAHQVTLTPALAVRESSRRITAPMSS